FRCWLTYEGSRLHAVIRTLIATSSQKICRNTISNTYTWKCLAAADSPGRVVSTPVGEILPFVVMPITWRPPAFNKRFLRWKSTGRKNLWPLCAPKPCGGAVTDRWLLIISNGKGGRCYILWVKVKPRNIRIPVLQ